MTIAEMETAVNKLEGALAEMTKRAEEAERNLRISKLDADDRRAFDALSKDDQEAFHACKSDDCRDTLLQKGYAAVEKQSEIPEPVKKRIEDVEKALKDEQQKREAAETVLKEEREKSALMEFAKRAESEIPHLPGTAEEKGAMLYAMSKKLDQKEFDAAVALLKSGSAANAQLAHPVGGDVPPAGGGSAWGRIEKRGEAVAGERKITKEAAVAAVIKENPELYTEYLREQQ